MFLILVAASLRCEYCIIEKMVELPRKVGEKYVLIRNVPAGVCKRCGTRYYTANVVDKTTNERLEASEYVAAERSSALNQVQGYRFAATSKRRN